MSTRVVQIRSQFHTGVFSEGRRARSRRTRSPSIETRSAATGRSASGSATIHRGTATTTRETLSEDGVRDCQIESSAGRGNAMTLADSHGGPCILTRDAAPRLSVQVRGRHRRGEARDEPPRPSWTRPPPDPARAPDPRRPPGSPPPRVRSRSRSGPGPAPPYC